MLRLNDSWMSTIIDWRHNESFYDKIFVSVFWSIISIGFCHLADFYDNNTNIKISTPKQHQGKNIDYINFLVFQSVFMRTFFLNQFI